MIKRTDWTSVYHLWIGLTCGFLSVVGGYGCGRFTAVTPADRAQAYETEARSVSVLCKTYRFDRAAGLTDPSSGMAALCDAIPTHP